MSEKDTHNKIAKTCTSSDCPERTGGMCDAGTCLDALPTQVEGAKHVKIDKDHFKNVAYHIDIAPSPRTDWCGDCKMEHGYDCPTQVEGAKKCGHVFTTTGADCACPTQVPTIDTIPEPTTPRPADRPEAVEELVKIVRATQVPDGAFIDFEDWAHENANKLTAVELGSLVDLVDRCITAAVRQREGELAAQIKEAWWCKEHHAMCDHAFDLCKLTEIYLSLHPPLQ